MGRNIRAGYAALKRQRSRWDVTGITLGTMVGACLCAAGIAVAWYAVRVLIGMVIGLWAFALTIAWVVHWLMT